MFVEFDWLTEQLYQGVLICTVIVYSVGCLGLAFLVYFVMLVLPYDDCGISLIIIMIILRMN